MPKYPLIHRYTVYVIPANGEPAMAGPGIESKEVLHRFVVECAPEAMAAMVGWMQPDPKVKATRKDRPAGSVRIEVWSGMRIIYEISGGMVVRH